MLEDYEPASNLTINYKYFCDQIFKEEIPVDSLYEAIGKLQIISITLDSDDNAQLIFESLNSTGIKLICLKDSRTVGLLRRRMSIHCSIMTNILLNILCYSIFHRHGNKHLAQQRMRFIAHGFIVLVT